jgi:anti-anti-sigma factor
MSLSLSQRIEGARRPEVRVEVGPTVRGPYVALIDLCGEHDLATAEAVRVSLAPHRGNVLVNLSQCDFIDSTVIGVVICKAQELESEGYRLELVVPAEALNVSRVFATIRMADLLTIHEAMPGAS